MFQNKMTKIIEFNVLLGKQVKVVSWRMKVCVCVCASVFMRRKRFNYNELPWRRS